MIFVRSRGVQADGDRVDQSLHIRRDPAVVDQVTLTIGVDSDRFVVVFLYETGNLDQGVKTLGRLTKPAENNLVKSRNIHMLKGFLYLLDGRLMLKPQGIGILHVIARLAQAEGTSAGAAVGQIDVQIIVYLI